MLLARDGYEHDLFKFYFENEKKLIQNYPGLNQQIFLQQWRDLSEFNLADELLDKILTTFIDGVQKAKPFQYMIGRSYFYRSVFLVNENVLIPRSETEILVEMAIKTLRNHNQYSMRPLRVCDVGTGSGAILLSILEDLDIVVEAFSSDISNMALKVSKKNFFNLRYKIHPKTKVSFVLSDRLEKIPGGLDLIVSNPPYIKRGSGKRGNLVHSQVHEYEPHLALYLEDSIYDEWFESFFKEAFQKLEIGGSFIMEGHEDFIKSLESILSSVGFNETEVLKDLTGRNRFLKGKKNG